VEQVAEDRAHLPGLAPVVRRAGVVLALGADERAILDPGDVPGVREGEVGVGALGVGEPLERARVDEPLGKTVVLLSRAVAPVNGLGLGEGGELLDPGQQLRVLRRDSGLLHGGLGLLHSR
jgi:hypothetical protein